MKFTINRKTFLEALQTAVSVSEKKATIPVLGYCKIETGPADDSIVITATDMDTGIVLRLFGKVEGESVTLLHVKNLLSIIAKADSEDAVLDVSENSVAIQCGTFKSKLQSMPLKDYPAVDTEIDGPSHMVDGALLRKGLGTVDYATTREASRFALACVKLEANSAAFRVVATDANTLAVFSTAENLETPTGSFLIPPKAIALLKSFLPDGAVQISGDKSLRFKSENWILVARTVDGQFPNWSLVLPKNDRHSVLIPRERFLRAVDRGRIGLEDINIRVNLALENGEMTISSRSDGIDITDRFPVGEIAHPFKIGFNAGYLYGGLRACSTDEVAMSYLGVTDNVDFQSYAETERTRFLIQPLRD